MQLFKTILFAWIWQIASSAAQDTSEKDRVFEEFSAAFAVVYVIPYENRRDDGGIPAAAYTYLDRLMNAHWRVLLSDIDRLPTSRGVRHQTTTASMITEACEALPPAEYLDLLDMILDLTEAGKIPSGTAQGRFSGHEAKNHFIAVNYEYPRVEKLIERARIVCADNEEMLDLLELYAAGKLADNYELVKGGEGKVYPELLPGIKRKRHLGSLIEKYERVTGKKVPPDPEFDPRPEKRGEADVRGTAGVSDSGTSWWLQALVAGVAVIAAAFGIWRYRKVKTVVG